MGKEVKKNYDKKSGFWPVFITLLIVGVLVGSAWCLMAFVFPKTFADFTYSIGLESYAQKLYVRDWEKSEDINSLYSALNISIKTENNEKTIELYEEFYADDEYADFVAFIDSENLKLDETHLIKASLLNEDNYLKNKYVSALIAENKIQKAFEFALQDNFNITPTCVNLGNFLFGNFVTREGVLLKDNFDVVLDGRSTSLLDDFYTYFNTLVAEFEKDYNNVETFYIISAGNRLQLVGNTINAILEDLGQEKDNQIVEKLSEINENLSTKLMD